MVLNDTEGTFIVAGFITALLLSLHWAVFYMLLAGVETAIYSGYYIDKQGIEKAGEVWTKLFGNEIKNLNGRI